MTSAPVPRESKPEVVPEKPKVIPEKPEVVREKAATEAPQAVEAQTTNLEERMHGDVLEHKHSEYDYWHPASRIHKKEDK